MIIRKIRKKSLDAGTILASGLWTLCDTTNIRFKGLVGNVYSLSNYKSTKRLLCFDAAADDNNDFCTSIVVKVVPDASGVMAVHTKNSIYRFKRHVA